MNFPLSLTILRILFVPLVVVLLLAPIHESAFWAVGVFLLASVTDLFDGYIARKRHQITALGILLDPLADKLLIASALIALAAMGRVPAWMVIVIVARELAVSGLRAVASAEGFALQAAPLGKTKMVFEVLAVAMVLLVPRFPGLYPWDMAAMWMVVVFAVASGTEYFWNFGRTLKARARERAAHRIEILPAGREEREKKDVAAHWG